MLCAAPLPDLAGPSPNRASRSPTTTRPSPSSPSSSSPPKSTPSSPSRGPPGTCSAPSPGLLGGRIAGVMSREGQKLDYDPTGGGGGSAGGVGIGVLSLDLLGQVLDRLRKPRDRKACRLRLDLSACASLDDASLAAAVAGAGGGLAGLRRVCLAQASGVGWRGLEALIAACPRLKAIDLSHCVGAGDREAAAVAAAAGLRELRMENWRKVPELRSLDISYLKVGNGSLRSIYTLEKLEELAMVGCSGIDDEGLELLSKGSDSLQSVDVSRCDHVTYQGLASLIDGRKFLQKLHAADCLHEIGQCFLSKLATLKETLTALKLDGLEVLDSLLQAIGEGCNNLVEIGLSKCSGVTDEGISSLVAQCSDLRAIDLTCCNLITNNALDSIAENCKMLERLRLESCSLINEKGLQQIATCCPNLKEIDLTDCGVNDAPLQHLAKCSELRILKLGLCSYFRQRHCFY
ncbi:unnamed protein product [Urochloa decumbens]|uniref:F-box/LRR-repeat protein 15-like leucin rich repeat domain-containing protein n=1 Tax=Urochloa decumbens TaxID=240449 RepID=A0ABC8YWR0_9POAL